MSLAFAEKITADYKESLIPDEAWWVVCYNDDCGASVPREDAEKIGGHMFCQNCIDKQPHFYAALRHYDALCAKSDGGDR